MKPDHKYYDITELIQRWSEHGVTEKDLLKYGADGKLQFSISLCTSTQDVHIEVSQYYKEKTVIRLCDTKIVSSPKRELFDLTPLTISNLLHSSDDKEVIAQILPWCDGCDRFSDLCDDIYTVTRYVLTYDPNDMQNIRHPDDFLIRCSRSHLVVKHAEFLRFDEVLNSAKHSTTGQGSEPVKETNQPDPEAERKEKEKIFEDLVKVATTFCQDEMEKNVQAPTKNAIQEYLEKYVDQESIEVGKKSALPDLIFREIFKLIPSELKRKIAEKTKK